MRLTEDDLAIIRHVAEHSFLRSTHIADLMQRPNDKILRRLNALFHNGYLDRPRAQLDYYVRGGSAPLVYALGNKGANFDGSNGIDWTDKNRDVKRPYIEHALVIADFTVALECAVRRYPTIKLMRAQDIAAEVARSRGMAPASWTLTAIIPGTSREIAVTPDKVFGLELIETGRRNYFVVEADRSTMPIERAALTQSSFKKKLLAYHYGHQSRQHTTQWGIPGFRVLTLAKTSERVAAMVDVVRDITAGKGSNVFLFTHTRALVAVDPLALQWLSSKGQPVNLVDTRL